VSELPPITTRAEAEERVRVAVGPQVAACERFMEFSWEVIGTEPWTGRPISEDLAELLIAGEMSRAFKSYRGVIDAALGGYGPQGRRKPAFTGLSGGFMETVGIEPTSAIACEWLLRA